MKIEKIKPIPKYIVKLIQKEDKRENPVPSGITRYYSYLTKNDGELVRVTVAVRNKYKKWYYKQCAVHGVHSEKCFVKDMVYYCMGGYITGWFSEGLTKYAKWYEDEEWGWSDDKYFNVYAPIVNMEYMKKCVEYKYAAWDKIRMPLFKYLRLYEKYPQIEYLTKAGLHYISDSVIVLRRAGKDKKFCKWLMLNKERLSKRCYYIDVIMRSYTSGVDLDEAQRKRKFRFVLQHNYDYKELCKRYDAPTLKRIEKYVFDKNIQFSMYKDYLQACTALGLDMSEDKNMFPHDFRHWHDVRIDEYKTKKIMLDAQERKEFYKKFAVIANKYLALQHDNGKAGFICIIAKSPAELMREGNALGHCVGKCNYDQKFVREDSLIFFVRIKDKPEVPFVTVEYSPSNRNIIQLHGRNNSTPDEETTRYIKSVWLPYANRKLRQIAA